MAFKLLKYLRPRAERVNAQTPNHRPQQVVPSYEQISSAASREAVRAYENHCARKGLPTTSREADSLIARYVCSFIDHRPEINGLDLNEREKLKRSANHKAQTALTNTGHYGPPRRKADPEVKIPDAGDY